MEFKGHSRSQVSVGKHGVFLPHRAEAFNSVDKLLVLHKLVDDGWKEGGGERRS